MKQLTFALCLLALNSFAQSDRWQQKITYTIDVQMDVQKNQFKGKEKLEYINNSPDSLNKIFIHLIRI